jgi:hypothetical protein
MGMNIRYRRRKGRTSGQNTPVQTASVSKYTPTVFRKKE